MPGRDSDDPLSPLRLSIAQAAERIQRLDTERQDLKRQINGLRGDLESLRAEMRRLQERWKSDAEELRRLRSLAAERNEVKERLGHLLSRLDSLYLAE